MKSHQEILANCFNHPPNTLGRSEDSVLIKVVFMLLWDLGWDPVNQIMLGFEVPKERMGTDQKAAVVPDIVVADRTGIYLVGEVKHWYTNLSNTHLEQVRRYQQALGGPRAFLTNGHHWVIFESGRELFNRALQNGDEMHQTLSDLIGLNAISKAVPFPYDNALEIGLSTFNPSRASRSLGIHGVEASSGPPFWDAEKYADPMVRRFLQALDGLVKAEGGLLTKYTGETCIALKDRQSGKKLIEYWPKDNRVYGTRDDYRQMGISSGVSDLYHKTIEKLGRPVTDIDAIITALSWVVAELRAIRQ